MNLQQQFLNSKGAPIKWNDFTLIQMDRIPIVKGIMEIHFIGGESSLVCGVALNSEKGNIYVSENKKAKTLYLWDEMSLPKIVEYSVACPTGELRVWNIYRINHSSGFVSEDAWTNNACMYVEELTLSRRRYSCSDGMGEVNLNDHVFEIEWEKEE